MEALGCSIYASRKLSLIHIWLSGIMQNEAMMSPEERMIYETFGGSDTIIKNPVSYTHLY